MLKQLIAKVIKELKSRGLAVDVICHEAKWVLRKYADDAAFALNCPFETIEIKDNLLLNEGITLLQNLLIGAGGTTLAQANAYIGVGDSATGEVASQTGLQAATNKVYVACDASYPTVSSQTTTWRGIFTGAVANFHWQEFTVANGNSDAATNLNRKVSDQGTKTSGQTWTLDLQITWS